MASGCLTDGGTAARPRVTAGGETRSGADRNLDGIRTVPQTGVGEDLVVGVGATPGADLGAGVIRGGVLGGVGEAMGGVGLGVVGDRIEVASGPEEGAPEEETARLWGAGPRGRTRGGEGIEAHLRSPSFEQL